jgi:hypothetical protein
MKTMKYLKLFEQFTEEDTDKFPDVFNNSLLRGVNIDKDEYIDDPKPRKVSIGPSDDRDYIEFLINYSKLGIPDPTKSVHMYFKPGSKEKEMFSHYGKAYQVIPEEGAIFGFNKELRNGGLGSTWWFVERTAKRFLGEYVASQYSNGYKFPDYYENKDLFIEEITKYQKDLIDAKVVGKLTYDELKEMSQNYDGETLHVWTESPCLHRRVEKVKQEPKTYKNEDLLTSSDFEEIGVTSEQIPQFYQSDFGKKIGRFKETASYDLRREEALKLLRSWKETLGKI